MEMGKFTDLTGKTFGNWNVLRWVRSERGGSVYECVCKCGTKRIIFRSNLISGKTKSCGCAKSEIISRTKIKHGFAANSSRKAKRIYTIWGSMMNRCFNPSNHAYHNYGGRGITVCDRWKDFENFLLDMGQPKDDQSIDRINNDGNYEPGNCRWSDNFEQMRNTSRTKLTDEIASQIKSGKISMREVCEITGCSPSTYYAVKKGINWK